MVLERPITDDIEGILEAVYALWDFFVFDVISTQVALQPYQNTCPLRFTVNHLNDSIALEGVLTVPFHLIARGHQGQVISEFTEVGLVQT
jgi:hypothetical protein